jgi:hypothetical protein
MLSDPGLRALVTRLRSHFECACLSSVENVGYKAYTNQLDGIEQIKAFISAPRRND